MLRKLYYPITLLTNDLPAWVRNVVILSIAFRSVLGPN
jgi:hypothetical protein